MFRENLFWVQFKLLRSPKKIFFVPNDIICKEKTMNTFLFAFVCVCALFVGCFAQGAESVDIDAPVENDDFECGWKNTTATNAFGATCEFLRLRAEGEHYVCALPIKTPAAECKKVHDECRVVPVTPEQEIEMRYRLCSRPNLNIQFNEYNCIVWYRPPANLEGCARLNPN